MTDRVKELEARYEKSQDQIDRLVEENQRIRGRLSWICNIMNHDADVTLDWIYNELEALAATQWSK